MRITAKTTALTASFAAAVILSISGTPAGATTTPGPSADAQPHAVTAQSGERSGTPTGNTTFVNHEAKSGDVETLHKRWAERAAHDPLDVNVTRFTHTLDFDKNRLRFFVKVDNLSPAVTKDGLTTNQYVDLFVSYKKGKRSVDAFGFGVDSRAPHRNNLGANPDVVSDECAKSVRNAPVRMNFKTDTVRGSVSLDCVPAGTQVHIDGWSEMWVNPVNPPNFQVSTDWMSSMTFGR